MFLSNRHVLANELVQKMDINIANISILKKKLEDQGDLSTLKQMNNCTFIYTKSPRLPKYIQNGLNGDNFTDVSNKLPCTYVKKEYECSEREIMRTGLIERKETIAGKKFYVFKDEFVKSMEGKIAYVLDEAETLNCYRNGDIEGYMKLGKDKYLTWYKASWVDTPAYYDNQMIDNDASDRYDGYVSKPNQNRIDRLFSTMTALTSYMIR